MIFNLFFGYFETYGDLCFWVGVAERVAAEKSRKEKSDKAFWDRQWEHDHPHRMNPNEYQSPRDRMREQEEFKQMDYCRGRRRE